MFYIFKWLSNLWNLRKIFDKYLPKIKSLLETADRQQRQMEDLRQEIINMKKDIERLKSPLGYLDTERMATAIVKARKTEIPTAEEEPKFAVNPNPPSLCRKPTIVVPEGLECVGEPEYSRSLDRDYYKPKPEVTKVDKYYDPQLGVEYTDVEINGDKVSSEDDTVKE